MPYMLFIQVLLNMNKMCIMETLKNDIWVLF